MGNQYRIAPNGDLRIVNMTLRELVRTAYGLHETQLYGGPKWFDVDRWSIEAKVGRSSPDSSRETTRQRLQALLGERFQLASHQESRWLSVLVLVPAKGGHKLAVSKPGQEPAMRGAGRGEIRAKSTRVEALSSVLSGLLGRIVTDRTGLQGQYDFELRWSPDATTERLPGQPANMAPADPGDGPTLYKAIQEQLGMKLESKRMAVNSLVIDRALRPTGN